MTSFNYLPLTEVAKVATFVQWGSPGSNTTTTLLATALNTAFGATAGFVQVVADTTSGLTANALVVANDNTVLTVPVANWIGYVNGVWIQLTPAQLAAQYTQYFTS